MTSSERILSPAPMVSWLIEVKRQVKNVRTAWRLEGEGESESFQDMLQERGEGEARAETGLR